MAPSRICRFHLLERCRYGDDCRFIHPKTVSYESSKICLFFQRGECKYGESCHRTHDNIIQKEEEQKVNMELETKEAACMDSALMCNICWVNNITLFSRFQDN